MVISETGMNCNEREVGEEKLFASTYIGDQSVSSRIPNAVVLRHGYTNMMNHGVHGGIPQGQGELEREDWGNRSADEDFY